MTTTYRLDPKLRRMEIIKDGTIVESVPTSLPLAEREARLAAHGYVATKPETRRQAARREGSERGRNSGYGWTRSGGRR